MENKGFPSVAAKGYQAPGVVVSYTTDDGVHTGKKFMAAGLQIAKGVPLKVGEQDGYKSFRLGLFGVDKLNNVDRTVGTLSFALDKVLDFDSGT